MKKTLLFLCLLSYCSLSAQIQFNNFETSDNLDIQLGPTAADSLWQIGEPKKYLFDEAFSVPNALVTDLSNTYPNNQSSSFTIEMTTATTWGFPFIQLEWMQKTDMEEGVDGGIVEASYDQGQTWLNVLNDSTYRPAVVGGYQWDTLANGQAGFTGNADWSWVAICWGTFFGTEPDPNPSSIFVRFTFFSDSIDTNQEGWMIDDLVTRGDVIGVATSTRKVVEPLTIFPNPSSKAIFLDLREMGNNEANLKILSTAGQIVSSQNILTSSMENYRLPINQFPEGIYYIIIETEEKIMQQRFVKIK